MVPGTGQGGQYKFCKSDELNQIVSLIFNVIKMKEMHFIKEIIESFSGVLRAAVQSVPEWRRRARGGGRGGGEGGPGQDGGHHAGHPQGGGQQDLLPPHVISALSMSSG